MKKRVEIHALPRLTSFKPEKETRAVLGCAEFDGMMAESLIQRSCYTLDFF